MRRVAPVLCAALFLVGAAGCAGQGESAIPETAETAVEALEGELQGLPGVDDVTMLPGQGGTQISLTVQLEGDVTPDQVQDVAVRANDLRSIDLPDGIYPGQIDMRMDGSVFSYFSLPSVNALRDQAGYWAELIGTGATSVTVRTFTQPLSTNAPQPPESPSTGGAPVLMNSPTGRYVGVVLDTSDVEQSTQTIDSMRGINDPGASVGEWHMSSADGRVKAEFASPSLPDKDDVATAASLLSSTEDLDQSASLSLRIEHPDAKAKITAKLTAFDADLEESTTDTIEDDLRETEIWPSTMVLVGTLARIDADYEVSLLSNAMLDAGNFVLAVSGGSCMFTGDDDWPSLSDELATDVVAQAVARSPGACAAA
ncbi:MAG: hypothetical protein ACTH31_05735 [Pseudoclavibacter sp.]